MTTVRTMVEDAASLVGEEAEDMALSDYNAQKMLRRFRRMLSNWSTLPLMSYVVPIESFAMVAGVRDYSSTVLANGRPTRVVGATVTLDQITYTVEIVGRDEFESISYKPTPGIPSFLYPEMSYPNATFKFWPTPYAAFTANLACQRDFAPSTFELTTDLALPPGYEDAMVDNLAVLSADLFGTKPSDDLKRSSREKYRNIKRNNINPGVMSTGLPNSGVDTFVFIYKGF